MTDEVQDVTIIGGAVMGLFTAYHAASRAQRVTVIEKGRIGDPATASFGYTRSYRCDYLDPLYVSLAVEARRLWREFEHQTGAAALVECGLINIAKSSLTPDLSSTYAGRADGVMRSVGVSTQSFERDELQKRYPYLDADIGRLHVDAGVVDVPVVTETLPRTLREKNVDIVEECRVTAIQRAGGVWSVTTQDSTFLSRALVITSGHGTNALLSLIEGCDVMFPLSKDRPHAKYFFPSEEQRHWFMPEQFPIVAYLDFGIYSHPIAGRNPGVKIGYYNPPSIDRIEEGITSVEDFVEECIPELRGVERRAVDTVDVCDYDLVDDNDFILGALPDVEDAYVGVGWLGTGYKFEPLVGRVLADCALEGRTSYETSYDISRFDPRRFNDT